MTTGIKLKLVRVERKISQEELAFKIGVAQATIGNWERGKSIKLDYIPKLAAVLKVPVNYFLEENSIISNELTTEVEPNKESGFEITIKAPTTLFDNLNNKMDTIINRINRL